MTFSSISSAPTPVNPFFFELARLNKSENLAKEHNIDDTIHNVFELIQNDFGHTADHRLSLHSLINKVLSNTQIAHRAQNEALNAKKKLFSEDYSNALFKIVPICEIFSHCHTSIFSYIKPFKAFLLVSKTWFAETQKYVSQPMNKKSFLLSRPIEAEKFIINKIKLNFPDFFLPIDNYEVNIGNQCGVDSLLNKECETSKHAVAFILNQLENAKKSEPFEINLLDFSNIRDNDLEVIFQKAAQYSIQVKTLLLEATNITKLPEGSQSLETLALRNCLSRNNRYLQLPNLEWLILIDTKIDLTYAQLPKLKRLSSFGGSINHGYNILPHIEYKEVFDGHIIHSVSLPNLIGLKFRKCRVYHLPTIYSKLESLELNDCDSLEKIETSMPYLRRLKLKKINKLKLIHSPLKFLNHLEIDKCKDLKEVILHLNLKELSYCRIVESGVFTNEFDAEGKRKPLQDN